MKTLSGLFALLFVFSCVTLHEDRHATYEFSSSDQHKLLNHLTKNTEVIYRNQDNAQTVFTITDALVSENNVNDAPMFGDVTLHLQQKKIYLSSPAHGSLTYTFLQRPHDYNQAFDSAPKKVSNYLQGTVSMIKSKASGHVFHFTEQTQTFTANGVTYSDVFTVQSPDPTPYPNGLSIIRFYYDYKNGVIGFDDSDGKEWRLVP